MNNVSIPHCDLVVPLGYGLDRHRGLPDAEREVLAHVAHIARQHPTAVVAFSSSAYFFAGSELHENQLKIELLESLGVRNPVFAARKGVHNSVDEAEAVRDEYLGRSKVICVVCDWAHARSVRIIWKQVFPESTIIIESIDCTWNHRNRAFLQQSRIAWFLACILRHVFLVVGGHDRVRKIRQPIGEE